MRISASSFPNLLVNQLDQLAVRQNRLQNQAATGQRIQFPEDDPAAVRRVLDLQADARINTQYQRNIQRQQDLAQTTFTGVKQLKTVSDRANEIATLAGGGRSPEELKTLATEVAQLLQQALEAANSKYQGGYLFGGTKSDQLPFVATTDAAGTVTSVAYAGNESVAPIEIGPGSTLTPQVVGANASGTGPQGLVVDKRTGADLFGHLIALQSHLAKGDTAAITKNDLPQLSLDEENLINHLGTNGAIQSRLEAAAALNRNRADSLEKQVSKEADADLAQTLVRLNETQNAYQAALQSGAQILNHSLLDYLR